jgi:peptidyl-prolyl cis-trans isomerase B (cyclophilin B)
LPVGGFGLTLGGRFNRDGHGLRQEGRYVFPRQLNRGLRAALLVGMSLIVASALPGCATDSKGGKKKGKAKVSVPFEGPNPIDVIDAYRTEHPVDKTNPKWKLAVPRPPVRVAFDPNKTYYWFLSTSEGGMKIKLRPEWAPNHVAATIYLTRMGFYNGLGFHRIIPGFMAQGGDPVGDGTGSPGFRYAGEFHKKSKHKKRGTVSMANSGPRTDGSQFFILFKEQPSLDGKHTVIGELVEGKGTLRSMEAFGSETGRPRKAVTIYRAEIRVE